MAEQIDFTIRLVSDAEPSSGFGTELVNSLVPRTTDGYPVIPASHIKGLMKQALLDVVESLNPEGADRWIDSIFGKGGNPGGEAVFSLEDARCSCREIVSTVTRTALTEHGTAKEGTLRTAQRISAGAEFTGKVHFSGTPSRLVDTLVRYALLSVMEIGGSRNRGCGACCVSITGEERTPGVLLKELIPMLSSGNEPPMVGARKVAVSASTHKQVVLKLTFTAKTPLCVPELPFVSSNNTMQSGFVIPASAVQGIVLHRINALEPAVADACFASDLFRVWPLLPVIPESEGLPVRVSSSHRISKLPDENGVHCFCDEIVESDEQERTPQNSPLKGADGVLAVVDGKINLWRSSDMPRSISAHAVVNGPEGERNLFTVESIAVSRFSGMILMPEDAAQLLRESLDDNPLVTVGKARSVRGSGSLEAEILPVVPVSLTPLESGGSAPVFIAQSPLVVEGANSDQPANEIIKQLVESARWGKVTDCAGTVSVLFWVEPAQEWTSKCCSDNRAWCGLQVEGEAQQCSGLAFRRVRRRTPKRVRRCFASSRYCRRAIHSKA